MEGASGGVPGHSQGWAHRWTAQPVHACATLIPPAAAPASLPCTPAGVGARPCDAAGRRGAPCTQPRILPEPHSTPTQVWGHGRVSLLGDAAHLATPFLAQGAGQALEDALALGHAVGEAGLPGRGGGSLALLGSALLGWPRSRKLLPTSTCKLELHSACTLRPGCRRARPHRGGATRLRGLPPAPGGACHLPSCLSRGSSSAAAAVLRRVLELALVPHLLSSPRPQHRMQVGQVHRASLACFDQFKAGGPPPQVRTWQPGVAGLGSGGLRGQQARRAARHGFVPQRRHSHHTPMLLLLDRTTRRTTGWACGPASSRPWRPPPPRSEGARCARSLSSAPFRLSLSTPALDR